MLGRITGKPSEWIRAYQENPPVDVKKIAEDLGLSIWELEDMPPGASGKLFPDGRSRSGWSIGVNRNESYTRKRFTIAHEISHFLLHRNDIRDGVLDDTLYRSEHLSGAQETEANKFAADILMPYGLLQRMAQGPGGNIDDLARKFGVSAQAMSIRLGIPLP
jgi:Zn-dependent peptidase ImmA (M78 family)